MCPSSTLSQPIKHGKKWYIHTTGKIGTYKRNLPIRANIEADGKKEQITKMIIP
jgi:hypothetical protein